MSVAHEHMRTVLDTLPDTFVLNTMTLNPVIPTGKHGIVFHLVSSVPGGYLGKDRLRDATWAVAVISPVTGPEAASQALEAALDEVLDVLETEPTVRWTTAVLEPYNERLWCYAVEVQMYNRVVPDPEPEPFVVLDDLTVAELKTYAADNHIDITGARLKADIVKAISYAPAEQIKE